jgi:hypothetical protein
MARFQSWTEPCIGIPRARPDRRASYEQRVKRAVRWLWSKGLYPGVWAVGMRVHGTARRDLNDRECRWRREVMLELGIPLQRRRRGA